MLSLKHITITILRVTLYWNLEQGDLFPGKPVNVREFCSCQRSGLLSGNCQGNVGKNLVKENCYNVCMVWVADTDCEMINVKTQCNRGSLASRKC